MSGGAGVDHPVPESGRSPERILVNDDHQRRQWALALNTTEDHLREAVAAVGDTVGNIAVWLDANPEP